jgi:hypothetical protein
MAEYKERKNDEGVVIGYIRATDEMHIPKAIGNRDYQRFLDWAAEGNTPDTADSYAPSLPEAKTKRTAEIKIEAEGLFRANTDQYSNQYAMELAQGKTLTPLPANISTYYDAMKQAFIDVKNTINAIDTGDEQADIVTTSTTEASFPVLT